MSLLRVTSRGVLIFAMANLAIVIGGAPAHAAPGDLDPTFGIGGKVATDAHSGEAGAVAVAIQPDGKIVVAGDRDVGGPSDFALARYTPSGSLDPTFGTGGMVTTDFGPPSSHDVAEAIAIQADGKIVVAGWGGITTDDNFQLARYTSTGALDPTFDTDGKVVTPIGSLDDKAKDVAIQPDGKIVVAGYSDMNIGNEDFAVIRYTPSGALDGSFGTGGKVTTPIGSFGDFANAVAIQPDGKIVAVGFNQQVVLARYTTSGALDQAFGPGGTVTTPIPASANDVALQPDGKIVVAGQRFDDFDFVLLRYASSGSLDSSFGAAGTVSTDFGSFIDGAEAVAVQPDGKIVAVGFAVTNEGDSDFGLAWYTAAGDLDPTFGGTGKITTDFGSFLDGANAVAIQDDGKVVAAGLTENGSFYDFALARYNVDPTTLSIGDASITEGDAGTSGMSFTVSLDSGSSQPVTVSFATVADTATSADFSHRGGTLTFLPGQVTKTVTVPVKGDLIDEPTETFFVHLSNASGAPIVDAFGEGTITDNDPVPALSVSDPTVTEGNSGTTYATFTLSLSNPSSEPITVDYETADGTAVAPGDYAAKSGTKVFLPGRTLKTVSVAVKGETAQEPNETFFLNLLDPDGATLADGQGQATITDDDRPTISINDRTVTETNGTTTVNMVFNVTLSKAGTSTITVQYATANNTAVAPGDYTAKSGTLTFSVGQTAKTVTIVIKGDNLDEPNETFFVNLSNATNATIADGQGIGTITDND